MTTSMLISIGLSHVLMSVIVILSGIAIKTISFSSSEKMSSDSSHIRAQLRNLNNEIAGSTSKNGDSVEIFEKMHGQYRAIEPKRNKMLGGNGIEDISGGGRHFWFQHSYVANGIAGGKNRIEKINAFADPLRDSILATSADGILVNISNYESRVPSGYELYSKNFHPFRDSYNAKRNYTMKPLSRENMQEVFTTLRTDSERHYDNSPHSAGIQISLLAKLNAKEIRGTASTPSYTMRPSGNDIFANIYEIGAKNRSFSSDYELSNLRRSDTANSSVSSRFRRRKRRFSDAPAANIKHEYSKQCFKGCEHESPDSIFHNMSHNILLSESKRQILHAVNHHRHRRRTMRNTMQDFSEGSVLKKHDFSRHLARKEIINKFHNYELPHYTSSNRIKHENVLKSNFTKNRRSINEALFSRNSIDPTTSMIQANENFTSSDYLFKKKSHDNVDQNNKDSVQKTYATSTISSVDLLARYPGQDDYICK